MAVQLVNPKIVYVVDHALATCMSTSTIENIGLILENIVFMHLRGKNEEIFYYKTKNGDEIDLAIESDSSIKLILVSWKIGKSEINRKREIKALTQEMTELSVK